MRLEGIHHVAIICSDYQRSKAFYVDLLGLEVLAENFRADRQSWKLDLGLPDGSRIEVYTRGQVNPFGLTFDPWGNAYEFAIDGSRAIVFSAGPDGVLDTGDDIRAE